MEDNKLDKIFEIVSFYDNCRWQDARNYNLINFYKDNLDADTKVLTHWLCYIMNRQGGFMRVFDIGGFIISELVDNYKNEIIATEKDVTSLLDPKSENSFIREDISDRNDKYMLICTEKPNKKILNDYPNINKEKVVDFKSRFLPSDYYNIRYTLDLLYAYNKSLSYFIAQAYKNNREDKEHLIQKILFSLYLLTYHYIDKNGQPNYENIKNQDIDVNKRTTEVKGILDNPESFEKEFKMFLKEKIFKQKRAWCSLRDFLKSPEFKYYFTKSILDNKYLKESELNELFSINMLRQLELPGDIWNNNPKFQQCILGNVNGQKEKKITNTKFNQFLRNHYKNSEILKQSMTYPEQFDITFDFVPRMCEKNNCNICPINHFIVKKEKSEFEKVCINDTTKYCPVALIACNYKYECKGKSDCKLLKVDQVEQMLSSLKK